MPESKVFTNDNGEDFAYIDSGPSADSVTYLFIHGAANNKHTWDPLFEIAATKYPDSRLIAYSQRGYDSSVPFTSAEKTKSVPSEVLLRKHADDFINFARFCTSALGVKRIVLVCWSKGCIIPLALFHYDLPFVPQIEAVVFYEIPLTAGWGLPTNPSGGALMWNNPQLTPDTAPLMFGQYVAGFYNHPDLFFKTREDKDAAQMWNSSSMQNEALRPILGKALETEFVDAILHAHFANQFQDAKQGYAKMVASKLRIGIVYGDKSVTECILGCFLVQELAGDARTKVMVVQGGNHLMHLDRSDAFFQAVMSVSS